MTTHTFIVCPQHSLEGRAYTSNNKEQAKADAHAYAKDASANGQPHTVHYGCGQWLYSCGSLVLTSLNSTPVRFEPITEARA